MRFQVWYQNGFVSYRNLLKPDPNNLTKSHVHLKDVEAAGMESAWVAMQGENWSPNGEARDLIRSKGLRHTSMSVGDVLVDEAGKVSVVASCGFKTLKDGESK